jgi:hypothetical protein
VGRVEGRCVGRVVGPSVGAWVGPREGICANNRALSGEFLTKAYSHAALYNPRVSTLHQASAWEGGGKPALVVGRMSAHIRRKYRRVNRRGLGGRLRGGGGRGCCGAEGGRGGGVVGGGGAGGWVGAVGACEGVIVGPRVGMDVGTREGVAVGPTARCGGRGPWLFRAVERCHQ